MTEELSNLGYSVVGVTALLPLIAILLVLQVNPYHALVMRGILGAIAALVYALFGAADVALTEALVGTFLSITLYAVAVRSSLTMRLGIVEDDLPLIAEVPDKTSAQTSKELPLSEVPLLADLRQALKTQHMQLEMITYRDQHALKSALTNKEIHASYSASSRADRSRLSEGEAPLTGHVQIRVKRLYEIMRSKLPPAASLSYTGLGNIEITEPIRIKETVS